LPPCRWSMSDRRWCKVSVARSCPRLMPKRQKP
jgi:hypothetical protein